MIKKIMILMVVIGGMGLSAMGAGGLVTTTLSPVPGSVTTTTVSNLAFLGVLTNGQAWPVETNFLIVKVDGDNTTGARNTGKAFANLYYAAGQSVYGDVIYVLGGTYNEGTNVVPHIPGRSIVGLGKPVLQFYATNTIINSNTIYLKPADNLYVENITVQAKTTNWFSVLFGSTTNSPSATNWLTVNFRGINGDSDVVYFNSTNLSIGRMERTYLSGYWDTFVTGTSINSNSYVEVEDFVFTTDFNNGITPSGGPRPINIQTGGAIMKFSKGLVRCTKAGMLNQGVYLSGGVTELNQVRFDVRGNTNILINTFTALYVNNCTTISNSTFYVENPNFLSVDTGPYYGSSYTFVMNSSFDTNADGFIYGTWVAQDSNATNGPRAGALVWDNNSIADSTTPVRIEFLPNNDLDGGVGGISLSNGVYYGNGDGLTNMSTFTRTNFISGKLYTNNTGANIEVKVNACLTSAIVAGMASLALEMYGNDTNYSAVNTPTLAGSFTNTLFGVVANNGVYTFTNKSTGAGNSAVVQGGQILIIP